MKFKRLTAVAAVIVMCITSAPVPALASTINITSAVIEPEKPDEIVVKFERGEIGFEGSDFSVSNDTDGIFIGVTEAVSNEQAEGDAEPHQIYRLKLGKPASVGIVYSVSMKKGEWEAPEVRVTNNLRTALKISSAVIENGAPASIVVTLSEAPEKTLTERDFSVKNGVGGAADVAITGCTPSADNTVYTLDISPAAVSGGIYRVQIVGGTYKSEAAAVTNNLVAVVNKDELTQKIELAQSELNKVGANAGIVISADGSDVPKTQKWVTESDKTALSAAIISARAVADNTSATQTEVNSAVTAITEAANTFVSAQKAGKKPDKAVDKTALTAAIASAQAELDKITAGAITVSVDGSDVPTTQKWVTESDKTALSTAITSARAVADNTSATQTEVNSAAAAVTSAANTFKDKIQNGKKEILDFAALTSAVAEAKKAIKIPAVSQDGADVSMNQLWVTPEALQAYQAAIDAAQATKESASVQADISVAVKALAKASSAFVMAQNPGTMLDFTPLSEKIAEAEAALKAVAVSADGRDVPKDKKWVAQEDYDALKTAIANTKKLLKGGVTEAKSPAEITFGANALAMTTDIFINARKNGAMTDFTSITDKITAAKTALAVPVVSTDGADVPATQKWVTAAAKEAFQTAITAAEAAAKDAGAQQDKIDETTAALDKAMAVFIQAQQAGKQTAQPGADMPGEQQPSEVPKNVQQAIQAMNPKHDSAIKIIAAPVESGVNKPLITGLSTGKAGTDTASIESILTGFQLDEGAKAHVKDMDGNPVTDFTRPLGTGMTIAIIDADGNVTGEAVVVVKGDLTGAGKATTGGFAMLANAVLNPKDSKLNAVQKLAGNMNGKGDLTIADFALLAASMLGLQ